MWKRDSNCHRRRKRIKRASFMHCPPALEPRPPIRLKRSLAAAVRTRVRSFLLVRFAQYIQHCSDIIIFAVWTQPRTSSENLGSIAVRMSPAVSLHPYLLAEAFREFPTFSGNAHKRVMHRHCGVSACFFVQVYSIPIIGCLASACTPCHLVGASKCLEFWGP